MDIQSVHLSLVSEAGNQDLLGAIIGIDFIHDTNIKSIIHIFSENPPSTMTLDYVYGLKCGIPYCTSIIPRATGYRQRVVSKVPVSFSFIGCRRTIMQCPLS